MENLSWLAAAALLAHWSIVIGLSIRIIMRRRPIGVLLAWMAIILSIPVLGVVFYLIVGENRISETYTKRALAIHEIYSQWIQALGLNRAANESAISPLAVPLAREARSITEMPALNGNRIELLDDYKSIFRAIIDDVRGAESTCHLEFYIWHSGGLADELIETLIDAARRGVVCRVLLDALGSKPFLGSAEASRLREAGVELASALPAGLLSSLFSRADLRNHRKLVVIDGQTGYTGSQNIVDPRYFKQEEGVGQWIDAMVRIEGPVVEVLGGSFIQDWEVTTGAGLESLEGSHDVDPVPECGESPVQLVPTGPSPKPMAMLQLLLSTIYSAQNELIVTTPYFVPDDSLLIALISAVHRGVEVTLVIPEKNDSRLVQYASQAVYDDLLAGGVRIAAFRGGLLHTKSVTVDGKYCLFGSVNMDMRSLWLNFELSLFIYDQAFTVRLRDLQMGYLRDSEMIDPGVWEQRSLPERFLENAVHLAAPLL